MQRMEGLADTKCIQFAIELCLDSADGESKKAG